MAGEMREALMRERDAYWYGAPAHIWEHAAAFALRWAAQCCAEGQQGTGAGELVGHVRVPRLIALADTLARPAPERA